MRRSVPTGREHRQSNWACQRQGVSGRQRRVWDRSHKSACRWQHVCNACNGRGTRSKGGSEITAGNFGKAHQPAREYEELLLALSAKRVMDGRLESVLRGFMFM